jgi:hypothetical protein
VEADQSEAEIGCHRKNLAEVVANYYTHVHYFCGFSATVWLGQSPRCPRSVATWGIADPAPGTPCSWTDAKLPPAEKSPIVADSLKMAAGVADIG